MYHRPSTEEVPVEEDKTIKYADVESLEVKQKALLVALGLVYYMRLGTKYRLKFVEKMDQLTASYSVKFKKAFSDEVQYVNIHIMYLVYTFATNYRCCSYSVHSTDGFLHQQTQFTYWDSQD